MNNQICTSTLSDKKFASFHHLELVEKRRWGILLATFFANFVLPSLLSSYGIILFTRKEAGVPLSELLISPCVFSATWIFLDPWLRDVADSRKSYINPRNIASTGIILCTTGVAINIWTINNLTHMICFGLLSGIGTSAVISQLNYVIADRYQVHLTKVRLLGNYGQAIGQCMLPSIFIIIFHLYGHHMGYLLISGMILQLLPFTLFLKTEEIKRHGSLNFSGSYVRAYSSDVLSFTDSSNGVPLVDLSKKTWKCPSNENLQICQDDEDDEEEAEFYDDKMKNLYGIDILPRIIEESEEEQDTLGSIKNKDNKASDQKQIEDDIKRLSMISDKLDGIIIKSEKEGENKINDQNDEYDKYLSSIKRNIKHSIDSHSGSHINIINCDISKYKCGCFPYRCYRLKRNVRNALDYTNDTFLRPFKMSLITWQFYPALVLKTSFLCILFSFSSLIALLGDTLEPKIHLTEIAFLLTLHGISWLFFLILTPWLIAIKKSKYQFISAFGSLVSAIGLFVVMESATFYILAFGVILTGFGYGAISISYEETLRNSIGIIKWSKLRGALEAFSGVCVVIITIWMSFLLTAPRGIEHCFGILITLLFLSGIMWLLVPLAILIRKNPDIGQMWHHT